MTGRQPHNAPRPSYGAARRREYEPRRASAEYGEYRGSHRAPETPAPRRPVQHMPQRDGQRRDSQPRRAQQPRRRQEPERRPQPEHGPRHRRREPEWVYWARRLATLAAILLVVAVVARACSHGGGDEPTTETVVVPPSPTAEPTPAEDVPEHIAEAWPVEMKVPSVGIDAPFQDVNCATNGDTIEPSTMDEACVYTAENRPYRLPGTDSPDIVVIAGHTGAGVHAVFNKLYDGAADRHTVKIGDVMYLRTAESGDDWLRYKATDLHDPEKGSLAGDAGVWGSGATPGRLITISCIQPANLLAQSVRNAVVGWQFDGVAGPHEVAGA